MTDTLAPALPVTLPDPAVAEFLELRLASVRVAVSDSPEGIEDARRTLLDIAAAAHHTVQELGSSRRDDLFASVCLSASAHIIEARAALASGMSDRTELGRARRKLYRGLCVVAEALTATTPRRASRTRPDDGPSRGGGVLFAAFVTQIVAAARSNPKDVTWLLHVADAEISIAAAHPRFSRLSDEQRSALRALRGEIATWSAGERNADIGYVLLNRLVLLVDGLNH